VVAADDNLVWVRELVQPVDGGLNLAGAAIIAEVASVDKQVSIGYICPFQSVRIGNADDSNGTGVRGRQSRRAAESKEDVVERIDEGGEGRGEEVVSVGTAIKRG
jgi:hypothetical protein